MIISWLEPLARKAFVIKIHLETGEFLCQKLVKAEPQGDYLYSCLLVRPEVVAYGTVQITSTHGAIGTVTHIKARCFHDGCPKSGVLVIDDINRRYKELKEEFEPTAL